MALIYHIICSVCGKAKDVLASANSYLNICNECQKKQDDIKRQAWLFERSRLSIEERIRKIEEWIYDYKPNRNNNFIMG
jgi:hypothetical protein